MTGSKSIMPSADELIREALKDEPALDVNSLHAKTYTLMVEYRSRYYERRVDEVLSELQLSAGILQKVKNGLLRPITVGDKEYSNFMEEVSRRVSQAFQPISGNLAELCVQKELERSGLRRGTHFTRREERTDFTVYHPNTYSAKAKHRVEVKNVSLRERATRGLAFDGDSLFGFFDQSNEFTESNVQILDELCVKNSGYCYVPADLLAEIPYKKKRFRENTVFGRDMATFAKDGRIT